MVKLRYQRQPFIVRSEGCAYCPSTNIRIVDAVVRKDSEQISLEVHCEQCGKVDRPTVGFEVIHQLIYEEPELRLV